MSKYNIKDKRDTESFAKDFLKKLKPKDIICLTGDLGAGKTFLVKCIAKGLSIKDDVISPTFNILKTYNTGDKKIKKLNHFDVYRIKHSDELVDIGFFESIYEDDSISIIEWADMIKEDIPKNAIWIDIKIIDKDKREITIS